MPQIRVSNLTKRFGSHVAVDAIECVIPDGSFATLLGPSGCGKTTTLRLLAGFERPDAGTIQIGSRVVADGSQRALFVPPQQRGLGVVFQSYALWPHMTVFDQVAYPLRARRVRKPEIHAKVRAMLDLVLLPEAGRFLPGQLSGGQQQRVALARALVTEPAVLLLDEPMSNLDAALRVQMREELRDLHRRVAITTVYVTHDQGEALALSDQVLVMREGRIVEAGGPWSIYDCPRTQYAAEFVGHSNCIAASFDEDRGNEWRLRLGNGRIVGVARPGETGQGNVGLMVSIKPEDIEVEPGDCCTDSNYLPGTIVQSIFLGAKTDVVIDCEGVSLRASLPKLRRFRHGERVRVHLPRDSMRVLH